MVGVIKLRGSRGEMVLDNGVGPICSHKGRVRGRWKEILGQKRGGH